MLTTKTRVFVFSLYCFLKKRPVGSTICTMYMDQKAFLFGQILTADMLLNKVEEQQRWSLRRHNDRLQTDSFTRFVRYNCCTAPNQFMTHKTGIVKDLWSEYHKRIVLQLWKGRSKLVIFYATATQQWSSVCSALHIWHFGSLHSGTAVQQK